ncbi:MAG: GGDEF domain-containing protein [Clostridia bacterium]|nr:GGDEF domain-containing protein [Clostridia bacterium]
MTAPPKIRLYQVLVRWFTIVGFVSVSLGLGVYLFINYQAIIAGEAYQMATPQDQQIMLLTQLLTVIIVIFFIMLLIIIPLAKYITGKIVTPLTHLTEKMEAFKADCKSEAMSWAALDTYAYQEIERLSRSFYAMAEKLGFLMENLQIQAHNDALTGIPNRHYFYQQGLQMIELTQRNERTCVLIFLDIDNFKVINDSHGHQAGDAVLIYLAKLLSKTIRFSDIIARIGGDEFTIMLPDTDLKGARIFAERLRQKIEESSLLYEDTELFITASMGVAVYTGINNRNGNRQEVLESLISRADAAMYRAKAKNRNRVEYDYEEDDEKQLIMFPESGEE